MKIYRCSLLDWERQGKPFEYRLLLSPLRLSGPPLRLMENANDRLLTPFDLSCALSISLLGEPLFAGTWFPLHDFVVRPEKDGACTLVFFESDRSANAKFKQVLRYSKNRRPLHLAVEQL